MIVLVIGSGGREHALVWKIAQSSLVKKIYCAPGNAGIGGLAECVNISVLDIEGLKNFALGKGVDLTVVGPELPLTLGIVDIFKAAGLKVFGPSKKAAELEGSKVFSKELMSKYAIPTAEYRVFTDLKEAKQYIDTKKYPLVIKADGLAGGKGAVVCANKSDTVSTLELIMEKRAFGDAGDRVIVEEFLRGEEASFIVVSDGSDFCVFPTSQDHKAIYDGDKGPNTGGMGAYSPAPVVTPSMEKEIISNIISPTLDALKKEGCLYKGFLYAGLMITEDGPKVLEFNCRMGDPEAQPLLMRLKTDIVPLLMAGIEGGIKDISVEWHDFAALCVVLASGGYPGDYKMGYEIKGLGNIGHSENTVVFHAGTSIKDGKICTNGGRVLGITSSGMDIREAIENAYRAADRIYWEGIYYRRDIGRKALKTGGR